MPLEPARRRLTRTALGIAAVLSALPACRRNEEQPIPPGLLGPQPEAPGMSPPAANATPATWGKRGVAPSSGCNEGRGLNDERTLVLDGVERRFIVALPKAYDGSVAYPLAFAFHGKLRSDSECQDVDCRGFQEVLGERAILVYMKSLNESWHDPGEYEKNTPFFDALLKLMKAEYCIDEHRVVVAGTSSGGFFANQVACKFGDQLLAVFPVGGALAETQGCQRPIAAVVLHGIDDKTVPFALGEATRDHYRTRNGCSEQTRPPISEAHAAVRADRDAGKETYRCVDYEGCGDGLAVRWCEHGEGGYDNSTHAWPSFGGKILGEFLDGL